MYCEMDIHSTTGLPDSRAQTGTGGNALRVILMTPFAVEMTPNLWSIPQLEIGVENMWGLPSCLSCIDISWYMRPS